MGGGGGCLKFYNGTQYFLKPPKFLPLQASFIFSVLGSCSCLYIIFIFACSPAWSAGVPEASISPPAPRWHLRRTKARSAMLCMDPGNCKEWKDAAGDSPEFSADAAQHKAYLPVDRLKSTQPSPTAVGRARKGEKKFKMWARVSWRLGGHRTWVTVSCEWQLSPFWQPPPEHTWYLFFTHVKWHKANFVIKRCK